MSERYYISTPIFYPNGLPHIGHAYNVISADVFARFHRLQGNEVLFTTGTDDHGMKMQRTAEKQGITPQELADKNSKVFADMMESLNCSADIFVRTTKESHIKSCQALWQKMLDNGDIYLANYEGWYSVTQEAYFDEKETTVDENMVRREPLGSVVEWNEEQSYFFKLSNYQDKLLAFYKENPDFINPPERRNEVLRFVESGLDDLSISRTSFEWGVPVPNDPKHVMYVWVDALTNYISSLGYPDEENSAWDFWPANMHLIGKDILRFHAVYWPAFLMSAGLPLPKAIFAHGFLLNKDAKMSKSTGNVVDPFELVKLYGLDAFRYFLMREISFGQDGNYSHNAVVNRINADLANDLGNLAQRSLSIVSKSCDGKIPNFGSETASETELLQQSVTLYNKFFSHMEKIEPHIALNEVFSFISSVNRYFANQEPWKLRKTDNERFETVLYVTLELLRKVALLLLPFIPESANKLLDLLAVPSDERTFASFAKALKAGEMLPEPKAIFPRFVAAETE